MLGFAAKHAARTLAVIALIFQALMPGMMAAASALPGEMPAVLCAMPADGVQGARSAVGTDLAAFIAKKTQKPPADTDHDCPTCVLADTAILPVPVIFSLAVTGIAVESAPVFEVRFAHVPRGPPLGARAPPVLLKA